MTVCQARLLAVLLLSFLVTEVVALTRVSSEAQSSLSRRLPRDVRITRVIVDLRGGSDTDTSEYDDELYDASDASESDDSLNDDGYSILPTNFLNDQTAGTLLKASKQTICFIGKIAMKTISAASRAAVAIFNSEENLAAEEDEEEPDLLTKFGRVLKRMIQAAFQPAKQSVANPALSLLSDDEEGLELSREEVQSKQSTKSKQTRTKADKPLPDMGSYFAKMYGVEATRNEKSENCLPLMGGAIVDALRIARSKARLLVVIVPAFHPGKAHAHDIEAIKGVLSSEVATVAERKARKSGQTGSYVIWGAKAGSSEAVTAMKRVKASQLNSKGQKRPALLVVYPAQIVGSDGSPKIVPRLLAQHHCSPPPSSEMMAAWLNALRKRHAKQFATMQLELREADLHRERTEGYRSSILSDRERQVRELREAEEQRQKELAEKERREAILVRREELRRSLPEEPAQDDPTSLTIALRLSDGRNSQRRFAADTSLASLFNWVDAEFELDRESVILSTLNGQKSFEWSACNMELREAGFSRMTGLRVTERKTEHST